MDYKEAYKTRRIPSLADALAKRVQNVIAERNEKRRELFWSRRGCPESLPKTKPEALEKKIKTRVEMLQKWKEEKQKKLEEAKKKQKPVFKVGVVHRKVTGSPLLSPSRIHLKKPSAVKQNHLKTAVNDVEKVQGVLTRSRAKKMEVIKSPPKQIKTMKIVRSPEKLKNKFCKIDKGQMKQVNLSVFKVPEAVSKLPSNNLTLPYSPTMMRNRKSVIPKKDNFEIIKEKTQDPFQSKESKENMELENSMTSKRKTPAKTDYVPIQYSPITKNASGSKKSDKKPRKSLNIETDKAVKKSEEFQCRIISFRNYIETETKRLLDACDRWRHIYLEVEEEVPDDVEGEIDCVIGKTNLLTSDKFMQFKGLIDKCENGDPLIKVDDLQGFQDWVSLEVERIDEDFLKLEKRKLNNWHEEKAVQVSKAQKVKVIKNTKKPAAKSNIRAHILAARKLLKEGNAAGDSLICKTFEEIVKVTTPKRQSLLKEVLTSETKKGKASIRSSPVLRERTSERLKPVVTSQEKKSFAPKTSLKANSFEIFSEVKHTPNRSVLVKTPRTLNSPKSLVKKAAENGIKGRGLSEKYFQPVMNDDCSPLRPVLRNLENLTPAGMNTRSRSKQFSVSAHSSPPVFLDNLFN